MSTLLPSPKRKTSIIIEDFLYYTDESVNPVISNMAFYIWVDSKYITELKKMPGIAAIVYSDLPGRNIVMIDKRYDIEDIKSAVIQYVKFSEGEEIHWSKKQVDKLKK